MGAVELVLRQDLPEICVCAKCTGGEMMMPLSNQFTVNKMIPEISIRAKAQTTRTMMKRAKGGNCESGKSKPDEAAHEKTNQTRCA